MTVSELIKELEKVENKNIEVIIQGEDPTDWVYNNSIEFVKEKKLLLNDNDKKKTKVFIINGGIF